ncbi:2-hydroxychromene-2-carboxylate isomerase [Rhodoplanes sp. TEM]|uniref:2-hydroxychromene-2-carboxylate isomerase n=1 Tax=Rhodoplanes tepidamans TaxID=200616 RepID=A0ABT5JG68_RHOTP|nr:MULTISPECIES: 2-hydroxychromene-2-carboxylate isomerase [Rhodoplanes]MDC7788572.1 2-hydroxychromene-2-carboxylate isomerase [Rhodoplanes tepidamans]MDC7986790.1 2-hydroxychromene-2-carboxylate isomerase [Rhodoplanes sp. TEM]MDQ0358554.1 2-hydroxychromene-2-carboxylate isomerase [Rhodoplanes tepidamans]
MPVVEWFYDVISPFAYIQQEQFHRLPPDVEVVPKPIVLGAILDHWKTKGPAEIPTKRTFTYRIAQQRAIERNVPYKTPPAHPFNPIRALRLAVAVGATVETTRTIMRFIWRDGGDVNTPDGWAELCARLGVSPTDEAFISSDAVKSGLRANTDRAVALGVFGVPTFHLNGELFWGEDATGLFLSYLAQPTLFETGEWARISNLPVGIQRKAA